jgi:NAD(P)-dependent dehydrogenase (short-subunit alcohol dehydrogenase family)
VAFTIDPELLGLVDEVALVVGGAGAGMGRSHCIQLARAGCHIVVADINAAGGSETVKNIEQLGRRAVFVETDAHDATQADRMVETALDVFGRLDVAVNNVGSTGGDPLQPSASEASRHAGLFANMTDEGWESVIRHNLMATVHSARAEAHAMLERQTPGRIINVASTAGLAGMAGGAAYGAAKAGVMNLTRAMAVELGPHNIRVNCIVPGHHPQAIGGRWPSERFQEDYAARTPLRRNGKPMETAGLAVAFASKLTGFVTGQCVASDGGNSVTLDVPNLTTESLHQ